MPSSRGSFWPRGWNLGLLHCRQVLYCLSHQGSSSSYQFGNLHMNGSIDVWFFSIFFSRITWCPSNLQKVTKRFFFFSVILNSFSFYKFNVSVFLLILTLSHFSRGGPFKLALTSCDPSFLALSHDVLDSSHICIPPHRTGIGQLSKNTKPSWWTVFREHDLGITAGFSETNLDLSCEQS